MASQATTGAGASIDNNLNPTTMALQATNGAGDSIEKELYIPKDFVKVCNCIAESRWSDLEAILINIAHPSLGSSTFAMVHPNLALHCRKGIAIEILQSDGPEAALKYFKTEIEVLKGSTSQFVNFDDIRRQVDAIYTDIINSKLHQPLNLELIVGDYLRLYFPHISEHPKKQMWQFALRTDSGNSTKGSGKKRNPDIRCLACQKVFRNCTITAIKNHSTAKSNFCTKMTENIIARVKEVLELKEEGKETIVNPGSKKLAKPVGCKQALLKLHKVKTAGEQAYSLMVDALLHSVREEMDFRRLQNLSDATGHLKHMLSQLNSVLNEIAPGTSVLPNESAPGTSVLPNESAPDTSVLPNESAPDTSVLPNESAPYNRHLESSEGFKVSKLQSMVDGAPNNKHLEFFEFDLQEFEELEALLEPKLQAPAALVQPHPSSSIDFGTHSLNALPPSQQQAHGNDPDEQIHNPAAPIRQLQGQSPARND